MMGSVNNSNMFCGLKAICAVYLALAPTKVLLAQGTSAHGGDLYPAQIQAWFPESQEIIPYCLEISKHYGIEKVEIENVLHESFRTWVSYLQSAKPFQGLQIRHQLQRVECSENPLIRFVFGKPSPDIAPKLEQFNEPVAVTIPMDEGGVVWLSNLSDVKGWDQNHSQTRQLEALHSMVLHELGHVFGIDHVDGTIMDERIAQRVVWEDIARDVRRGFLTEIDDVRILLPPSEVQHIQGFVNGGLLQTVGVSGLSPITKGTLQVDLDKRKGQLELLVGGKRKSLPFNFRSAVTIPLAPILQGYAKDLIYHNAFIGQGKLTGGFRSYPVKLVVNADDDAAFGLYLECAKGGYAPLFLSLNSVSPLFHTERLKDIDCKQH